MVRTPNLSGSANLGGGRPAGEVSPEDSSTGRPLTRRRLDDRHITNSPPSAHSPPQKGAQRPGVKGANAMPPLAQRQLSSAQPLQGGAPPSPYAQSSPHPIMQASRDAATSSSQQAQLLSLEELLFGESEDWEDSPPQPVNRSPVPSAAQAATRSTAAAQTQATDEMPLIQLPAFAYTAAAQHPEFRPLDELLSGDDDDDSEDASPQSLKQSPVPPAALAAAESPAQQFARLKRGAQPGLRNAQSTGLQPPPGSSPAPHHSGARGATGASAGSQGGASPAMEQSARSAAGPEGADAQRSGETDPPLSSKKRRKSAFNKPDNFEVMTDMERKSVIATARQKARRLNVDVPSWVPPLQERRSAFDKPVNWETMTDKQKYNAAVYTSREARYAGELIPDWVLAFQQTRGGARGAAGASAGGQGGASPVMEQSARSAAGPEVADAQRSGETEPPSSSKKRRKSAFDKPDNLEGMTAAKRKGVTVAARIRAEREGVDVPSWVRPPQERRRSVFDKPVNWETMTDKQKRKAAVLALREARKAGMPIPDWVPDLQERRSAFDKPVNWETMTDKQKYDAATYTRKVVGAKGGSIPNWASLEEQKK